MDVMRMLRAHPHMLENPVQWLAESTYFFFLRSWYTDGITGISHKTHAVGE